MPALAIFRHELRALRGNRLVWTWLVASGVVSLLVMASGWAEMPTSHFVATFWSPFLVFPWFLVAMTLGITPVTGSRAESLADGILSRPVTRYEYFVACWAARVVAVLAVFVITTLPFVIIVAFAKRPVAADAVSLYGVTSAMSVVALVLAFQVSLGFLLGTLLRSTLFAAMVLIFIWFPINMVLTTFELYQFSPISLNQALPTVLKQTWRETEEEEIETGIGFGDFVSNPLSFGGIFVNPSPPPKPEQEFYGRESFEEVSLFQVLLGYGIPTLLCIALATFCFARRDL